MSAIMNRDIVNLIAALRVIRSHAEVGLSDAARCRDEVLRKIIATADSEISAVWQLTERANQTKDAGVERQLRPKGDKTR